MKIGIIARADKRGLGNQTREAVEHLDPTRVLVIDPGDAGGEFAQHPEWYDRQDALVVPWAHGELPDYRVKGWLRGLDVVYTAETFYDWRIPEWAYDLGVGTVCHINPELFGGNRHLLPVTWWAATPWRLDFLPRGTRVVPMPVAVERFPSYQSDPGGPIRFLHTAGHRAAWDRNGTTTVARATRQMRSTCDVIIRGQNSVLPVETAPGAGVRLTTEPGGVDDYWDLYAGGDVLVLPRRYGGLCLPAQEAMAAGLALVMSDVEPNQVWPIIPLPARAVREVDVLCGTIALHEVNDWDLAEVLDDLATHPEKVRAAQDRALAWAVGNSWSALAGRWESELAAARVA